MTYLKLFKAISKLILVVVGIALLFQAASAFSDEEFTKAIYLLLFSWLVFWLADTD